MLLLLGRRLAGACLAQVHDVADVARGRHIEGRVLKREREREGVQWSDFEASAGQTIVGTSKCPSLRLVCESDVCVAWSHSVAQEERADAESEAVKKHGQNCFRELEASKG